VSKNKPAAITDDTATSCANSATVTSFSVSTLRNIVPE
jgi:hypothetical protein